MTLKSLRRFGTVLLAAALSVQLCIPAFAVDRSGEEDPYAIFQKEEINPEGLRANDQVRIVVELEAAPLLASSQAVQAYGSVSDYLSSARRSGRRLPSAPSGAVLSAHWSAAEWICR